MLDYITKTSLEGILKAPPQKIAASETHGNGP